MVHGGRVVHRLRGMVHRGSVVDRLRGMVGGSGVVRGLVDGSGVVGGSLGVAVVGDLCVVAAVVVSVVLDVLCATVGQHDTVLSLDVVAIAVLLLGELGAVVRVVDGVVEGVGTRVVVVVSVAVLGRCSGRGGEGGNHQELKEGEQIVVIW